MDTDDCDLLAIVRSCKATTITNHTTVFETPTPTNNTIFPQNPTPYFEDFTFTQGNSSTPCVPLKPNDFIELEKLKIIPTPTTIPTPITFTNNNSVYDTNQNSTFYNFPTLMEQQQMQLNLNQYELDLTEQTKLSYYDEPRFEFPSAESPIFNFEHASNRVNCITITTDHFDLAYNHPSLQLQPQQELNQLPIQEPQTNSMVLANANPQPNKQRSRKRKNQPLKMICEMNAQKLLEDPWAWRKYGQKPIKGSPYPRSYYRCSSARECGAKKLVEKSHTNENTFLVTYTGEHNHEKPINRIMVSTPSWNKPPETRLLPAGVVGPSQNMVSPNAMLWFDQPESGNSPIHGGNAQVNNDDNIVLVPNMMAVSEASLMNFNPLNIGNIPFVESNP